MKLALLAALALALGCSSDKRSASRPVAAPVTESDTETASEPESVTETASASPIPPESTQLVVALVDDWAAVPARLQRFERTGTDQWQPVGESWQSVIGARGSGWGIGLHGSGAPDGQPGPNKVEGDGKSPAGVFALGSAFGYADEPPDGARIGYQRVDDNWRCIDDPDSSHYNRVIDRRGVNHDWSSAERMRRPDDLYRWVIYVDHNPDARPGAGSCIFLHVWGGKSRGSAGCTAMAEDHVRGLVTWLDPAKKPVFVLLAADPYRALTESWQLPKLD